MADVGSLGSSLVGGVFDATGAATQAAIQGAVSTGVSQSISGYNETVRQGIGTALASGANGLLDSIGIKTANIPIVGGILQNVAQSGITAAATVFAHIIDGNLTLNNLPLFGDYATNSILSGDSGNIGSIAGGLNTLTDTVTGFVSYALNNANLPDIVAAPILNMLSSTGLSGAVGGVFHSTGANTVSTSSYAAALDTNVTHYVPKFKFLYIVEIRFVQNEYNDINNDFTFLIKHFERPKITIEHDEVNFYGYRSMVPKRTVYQPINLDMHDDIKNLSMNFLVSYLRRVSPIFNQTSSALYEKNSMNFSNPTSSYGLNTHNDNVSIIEHIKVYHLFNFNASMDVYTFFNPKILEVTLDDLDMSSGTEGNMISLNIAYDGVTIDNGIKAKVPESKLKLLELKANETGQDLGIPTARRANTNRKHANDLNVVISGSKSGGTTLNPLNTIKSVAKNNIFENAVNLAKSSPLFNQPLMSPLIDKATNMNYDLSFLSQKVPTALDPLSSGIGQTSPFNPDVFSPGAVNLANNMLSDLKFR